MVQRIAIGNYGSGFIMRVSKPGFDAKTAAIENLLLHETMIAESAYVTNVVNVPAGQGTGGQLVNPSAVMVNVGRTYTSMPKIILRCDQNFLPSGWTFFCALELTTGNLYLYNRTFVALAIRYAIFMPQTPVQL